MVLGGGAPYPLLHVCWNITYAIDPRYPPHEWIMISVQCTEEQTMRQRLCWWHSATQVMQGTERPTKGHRWLDSQELCWHHLWHHSPLNRNHSFSLSALLPLKVFGLISGDDEECQWVEVLLWDAEAYIRFEAVQIETEVAQAPQAVFSLWDIYSIRSLWPCGRQHSWP